MLNMTDKEAGKIIVIAGTVTFGSIMFGATAPKSMCGKGQFPSFRPFIGAFFAFTALSMIANVAPEVAGGLALSIGTVAYLEYMAPITGKYFNQAKECK